MLGGTVQHGSTDRALLPILRVGKPPDNQGKARDAFMLADEILKQYDVEHSHVLFFIAQLISFVALHVLPS